MSFTTSGLVEMTKCQFMMDLQVLSVAPSLVLKRYCQLQ